MYRMTLLLVLVGLGCEKANDLPDKSPTIIRVVPPGSDEPEAVAPPVSATKAGQHRVFAAEAPAQGDGCEPEAGEQRRAMMKNRTTFAGSPVQVTVKDVVDWPVPEAAGNRKARNRDDSLASQESTVWTVTGWVQLAKKAGDCDIHMEMTDEAGSTDRIVVEIPNGSDFDQARNTVQGAVGPVSKSGHKLHTPVHMRVTGFGFWDSAHSSQAEPKKGHNHGSANVQTMWEIHPVWRVEVL